MIAGVGYLIGSVESLVLTARIDFLDTLSDSLTLGELPIILWLLIRGANARHVAPG